MISLQNQIPYGVGTTLVCKKFSPSHKKLITFDIKLHGKFELKVVRKEFLNLLYKFIPKNMILKVSSEYFLFINDISINDMTVNSF